MSTVDELFDEALSKLYGGDVPEENELNSDITESTNPVPLKYELGSLRQNSIMAIGTELMRVWSVDPNTQEATVRRGYMSTTPALHANGDLVTVNPKYSKAALLKALEEEVRDLSSPINGLYRMLTTTLTYSASTVGYDLSSVPYLQSVYAVRHEAPGSFEDWVRATDWTLMRNQENTGGVRLKLPTGYPGGNVRIEYKADFMWNPSAGVELADDVETITGIPSNMHDILVLGLVLRVGPTREIKRNQPDVQGSSRRAEEVPPGSITNSFRTTQALKQARITAEAARLLQMYEERTP